MDEDQQSLPSSSNGDLVPANLSSSEGIGMSNSSENLIKYVLIIGFYLSIFSLILLLILVFADLSTDVQQVFVIIIGLLLLGTFSAFKKVINFDQKSDLLAQYTPYFDNRIMTNNTYYQGDTFYNKQSLAEAAEEIQNLLDKLSKTYDESPIDRSSINTEVLRTIEEIESAKHEKLTDKEKFITAKMVEEINKNSALKQRLTQAMKSGSSEALQQSINHPAIALIMATIEGFTSSDAQEDADLKCS